MAIIGFESMVIRVLDGQEPTPDTNLFTIDGTPNKGATKKAEIKGLSGDITKTYGSNIVYHTASKGVGDVAADFDLTDIPLAVQHVILGRKKKNGLTSIGTDTEAPLCSVAIWAHDTAGEKIGIGFYKGRFAMEAISVETEGKDKKELPDERLSFSAMASDEEATKGDYVVFATSTEEATKMKKQLKHSA